MGRTQTRVWNVQHASPEATGGHLVWQGTLDPSIVYRICNSLGLDSTQRKEQVSVSARKWSRKMVGRDT